MRRAAIAAMAAAGLVLIHAVLAQAGGSQQELCALITSARHAVGPEIAAMERTSDPARLQALRPTSLVWSKSAARSRGNARDTTEGAKLWC